MAKLLAEIERNATVHPRAEHYYHANSAKLAYEGDLIASASVALGGLLDGRTVCIHAATRIRYVDPARQRVALQGVPPVRACETAPTVEG